MSRAELPPPRSALSSRRTARSRGLRRRRRSLGAAATLALLAALGLALALQSGSAGRTRPGLRNAGAPSAATNRERRAHPAGLRSRAAHGPAATASPGGAADEAVPILMYHVINPPPPGAPFPGLYVPAPEFSAQIHALAAAGYHAVTMDQLDAHWTTGAPLPPGRPIVLSFDNGYQSQYTNALPVLRRLGWTGVENIQLSGLPPSQGGLSEAQVRGLIAAGWELDTQGYSHAELTALPPAELDFQIAAARRALQRRYHVPVNWFCYPSGHYDSAVIAEVRAAGYLGSTTVVPGWASPRADSLYSLPRIRVPDGTSAPALLSLISGLRGYPPPPPAYT